MKKDNNKRGETWNGFRPSIIQPKKKDKNLIRKQNKQICRDAVKKNPGT